MSQQQSSSSQPSSEIVLRWAQMERGCCINNSLVSHFMWGCAVLGKTRVIQGSASRSRPWEWGMWVPSIRTASWSVLLKRLYRTSRTSNQTQTSHSTAVYEQGVHFAFSVAFGGTQVKILHSREKKLERVQKELRRWLKAGEKLIMRGQSILSIRNDGGTCGWSL